RPAARHSLGSWVVLPEPVSPATTTTWRVRSSATIRSAAAAIGSDGSASGSGNAGGGGISIGFLNGCLRANSFPTHDERGYCGASTFYGVPPHGQVEDFRPQDRLPQGRPAQARVRSVRRAS